MRTEPATVSKLPSYKNEALLTSPHVPRQENAARSANSRICPLSMINNIYAQSAQGHPQSRPMCFDCRQNVLGESQGNPTSLFKMNATHVSAKTKVYAAIPNRHTLMLFSFYCQNFESVIFPIFFLIFILN